MNNNKQLLHKVRPHFLLALLCLPLGLHAQTAINRKSRAAAAHVEGDLRVRNMDKDGPHSTDEAAILIPLPSIDKITGKIESTRGVQKMAGASMLFAAGLLVSDKLRGSLIWQNIQVGKGARLDFTGKWGVNDNLANNTTFTFSVFYVPGQPVKTLSKPTKLRAAGSDTPIYGVFSTPTTDTFTIGFLKAEENTSTSAMDTFTFKLSLPDADGCISIAIDPRPSWMWPEASVNYTNNVISGSFKSIPILE